MSVSYGGNTYYHSSAWSSSEKIGCGGGGGGGSGGGGCGGSGFGSYGSGGGGLSCG